MDDPVLLGVREPGEQPLEHAADLRQRHVPDVRPQRAALDVLHRDVRRAVVLEVVVHGDDVRMAQRAGDARLAQEALRERGVRRVERRQLLERDEAVEVGLAREVDHRHAAAADLAEDLVAADRLQDVRHRLDVPVVTDRWRGTFHQDGSGVVWRAPAGGQQRHGGAWRQAGTVVKLFVVDPHTIYRRGLAACLEGLPRSSRSARPDSVREAWEDEALFAADLVLVDHAMTAASTSSAPSARRPARRSSSAARCAPRTPCSPRSRPAPSACCARTR